MKLSSMVLCLIHNASEAVLDVEHYLLCLVLYLGLANVPHTGARVNGGRPENCLGMTYVLARWQYSVEKITNTVVN